jgi:molecular chaperone GrpE
MLTKNLLRKLNNMTTDDTMSNLEEVLDASETLKWETEDQITTPVDPTIELAWALEKAQESAARATADYQNLLKRSELERAEMSFYFTENFAKKLLPTLDNLDRVVSGTPTESQNGPVYEGVKNAAAGLLKVLEGLGVSAFESLGVELDPNLHEALTQGPGPAGIIVSEFERGYKLKDKVIRHAKVVVGMGESL